MFPELLQTIFFRLKNEIETVHFDLKKKLNGKQRNALNLVLKVISCEDLVSFDAVQASFKSYNSAEI